jgi:RNA polymerase sigma-70 factor (ECF subfamily)
MSSLMPLPEPAEASAPVSPDATLIDAVLMARAAKGERAAFDALCPRHLPRLYVLAVRVGADPADAEEIAQDAMVRAWRNARAFDPARGALAGWLNRIAVNLAIDRCRAQVRQAALTEDIAAPEPDPEAAARRRELRATLAAGLAALPERQRAAFVLTYGEDRSGAEAAGMLGVSVRALEGLLRRARLSLRDWMEAREG